MLAYLRAAIRASDLREIDTWDIETLRAVYHLLPRPQVSFEEWSNRMGFGEPQADTDTGEEIADANERFIEFCRNTQTSGIRLNKLEAQSDEIPSQTDRCEDCSQARPRCGS
jgi:hypothetical protein